MKKIVGFTMAEILLSLTIIGVVAAITLPSLTGNVNERVWNTQRKALYARFSQAIALMPGLSGYGSYVGSNLGSAGSHSVSVTTDTAAEAFLTDGLSKVLKINNICDAAHLADCGISSTFTNIAGSTKTFPTKLSDLNTLFTGANPAGGEAPQKDIDTKAAAFETQNGESIAVFYNPQCQPDLGERTYYVQPKMCANFIYDLNGNKGPNAVGKDIGFITALYASDPVVVAPMPLASNAVSNRHIRAAEACTTQDSESRLPNKDELASMFYNLNLVSLTGGGFWSGSKYSANLAYNLTPVSGSLVVWDTDDESAAIRCVKR